MEQQQQPSPETGSGKVRRMSQRQYQMVMLIAGLFVAVGTILWGMGVLKSDPDEGPTQTESAKNETKALAVPGAKNKPMETDKYKEAQTNDARFRNENDPNRSMNMGAVVGAGQNDRQVSNEHLNGEDYLAVTEAGQQQQRQSAVTRKRQAYNQSVAEQRAIARENARLADPNAVIFRKSAAESAEERRTAEDREINQRTANLLLDRMEQGGQGRPAASGSLPGTPIVLEQAAEKGPVARIAEEGTIMHGEVSRNTVAQPNDKIGFFYNFSRKNQGSYSGSDAILAMVHGQGSDGITVQDGTTAKVRLMQNTVFRLEGRDVILEKGTLLNGICTLGRDRVFISITSLVIGTAIYTVKVQAFDLDGQQGVYVPNLADKNRMAQGLTRVASQSSQGGSYIVSQGGVGRQVGTQVAVQGARSALQGARQILTTKAQSPKVTIRLNYKVLLKSADLFPTSSTNQDYEGY